MEDNFYDFDFYKEDKNFDDFLNGIYQFYLVPLQQRATEIQAPEEFVEFPLIDEKLFENLLSNQVPSFDTNTFQQPTETDTTEPTNPSEHFPTLGKRSFDTTFQQPTETDTTTYTTEPTNPIEQHISTLDKRKKSSDLNLKRDQLKGIILSYKRLRLTEPDPIRPINILTPKGRIFIAEITDKLKDLKDRTELYQVLYSLKILPKDKQRSFGRISTVIDVVSELFNKKFKLNFISGEDDVDRIVDYMVKINTPIAYFDEDKIAYLSQILGKPL